ncbi:MAG: class I SAM-dependent methyltransferase [Rickettsiales bacterium]|jgi:2-polyprenyl-3-methyl-5-hydroxy-6-metoxy-1,4-benzoquinol methylase|nr:class I SAM-dependent methyltransferase [Rickettsiales bacterium]
MTISEFNKKPYESIISCPLCATNPHRDPNYFYAPEQTWTVNGLMKRWQKERGFVPIPPVYQWSTLEKRECQNCGLFSYNLSLRDDYPGFYEKLVGEEHQYYHPGRTEYDVFYNHIFDWMNSSAVNWDAESDPHFLEIGCGNGFLLEKLAGLKDKFPLHAPKLVGSETNEICISNCRTNGIDAEFVSGDLKELFRTHVPNQFQCILASQVLEHIADIKSFLDDTNNLLPPGGRFYVAVPNPEQIKVTGNSILNIAPHHQIDFSEKTFNWIAKEYGWEIKLYHKEPLTERVYRKYKNVAEDMQINKSDAIDPNDFARVAQTNFGHTHMVCFEKQCPVK